MGRRPSNRGNYLGISGYKDMAIEVVGKRGGELCSVLGSLGRRGERFPTVDPFRSGFGGPPRRYGVGANVGAAEPLAINPGLTAAAALAKRRNEVA